MAEFSKMNQDELVKACAFLEIIGIDGNAMCLTVQKDGRPQMLYQLFPIQRHNSATEAWEGKSNEMKGGSIAD